MSDWTPDRVTQSEAASRLGKTAQAMSRHIRRFAHKPGVDGKYDFAELEKSVKEGESLDHNSGGGSGRVEAYTRKLEAEARLLEIKVKLAEAEAVNRESTKLAWERVASVVKSEVLALGAKVGPLCEGQPAAVCIQKINEAAADTLRHLAAMPEPVQK